MRVILRVVEGPHAGRVFTFDKPDTFLIGRAETAHFCLPDDRYFSRHHCLLEISPPRVFLRDLNSTNGTYVNGVRVETAHLKSGDRIQGGKTVIEVEVSVATKEEGIEYEPTSPSLVTVTCLNCGQKSQTEASSPDTKFCFICEVCRQKLKDNPHPIPGYQMIKVLGQGGMGSVILAKSIKDNYPVAIKTLLPEVAVNEQSLKRFIREIEVLAKLRHPNIVSYLDHGTYNGVVYLISEFVNGVDASKLAKQHGGKIDYRIAISIIEQVLSALDYAHRLGYVHRDIKEQNILVQEVSPKKYIAKITDFGLAKSFKDAGMSGVTMVGDVAGTVIYMPPEQIRDFKDVKPPSDIYAVGMTLYVLITGNHALDVGSSAGISEIVKAIFDKPIVPVNVRDRSVPISVATVIEKALAKNPKDRWKTAGEMRQALLKAAGMA
jgi:serine/threonine-protein kinase